MVANLISTIPYLFLVPELTSAKLLINYYPLDKIQNPQVPSNQNISLSDILPEKIVPHHHPVGHASWRKSRCVNNEER